MRVIYHKNFWFYPAIFVFTLVCFLLRSDDRYFYEVPVTSTTRQLIVTGYSSRFVHVTKSMKELGKMDELSGHILFFTRVPYCGSEVLSLLLQWLQGWNNFRRVRLKDDSNRILNLIDQVSKNSSNVRKYTGDYVTFTLEFSARNAMIHSFRIKKTSFYIVLA